MTSTKKTGAYALASTLAVAMLALPGLASAYGGWWWGNDDGDVNISNNNGAFVSNTVVANAGTGSNTADGDNAGNGGNANGRGNNTGGNGGNGGHGGLIVTGFAVAEAGASNTVNTNDTRVSGCGCEGNDDGDVTVSNSNHAFVMNNVVANAGTGNNDADGANGGNGGNANGGGGYYGWGWHHHGGGSNTGGNGGNGGNGGGIGTGSAEA